MSDTIKGALIIGGAIVIAMALYLYYSPYQTCVRAYAETGGGHMGAQVCGKNSN